MSTGSLPRPAPDECNEYYFTYIDRVPDGDVLELLEEQIESTPRFLASLDDDTQSRRYAPGKWSVKEVVGHLIDVERVFGFRALCAVRNDSGPIPGMNQDAYAEVSGYGERAAGELIREYRAVRGATLALLRTVRAEAWGRRVTASGLDFTARTVPFILAGHEIHHLGVIRDRYL